MFVSDCFSANLRTVSNHLEKFTCCRYFFKIDKRFITSPKGLRGRFITSPRPFWGVIFHISESFALTMKGRMSLKMSGLFDWGTLRKQVLDVLLA